MFRLLEFIRSTYVVILFVIAEVVAVSHYAWSDSYTRAKIFVVSNSMMGGASGTLHSAQRLFSLPSENRNLVTRVAELESELAILEELTSETLAPDAITFDNPEYTYTVARVVSNSITKSDNYIVLDKGVDDDIYENMAVITPSGQMVGYIVACSGRYSAALSVLSRNFTTSGKILGGDNYGSIGWDGHDRYSVTMSNLSKYEIFEVGDTVVSTGFSQIFPGGVTIGTVSGYELNETQTAYSVEVELAAQITAVDYLLIVGSRDSGEIESLLDGLDGNYNN